MRRPNQRGCVMFTEGYVDIVINSIRVVGKRQDVVGHSMGSFY